MPGPMKALSCTQPWAQLVVEGWKTFETRSWDTGHRGPIAIHASKGFPAWAKDLLNASVFKDALKRPPAALACGAIIGVVSIKATLPVSNALRWEPSETELAFGDWSEGRYIWELENPILLLRPIPAKGALRLWTLPEDIQGQLNQQLEALNAL